MESAGERVGVGEPAVEQHDRRLLLVSGSRGDGRAVVRPVESGVEIDRAFRLLPDEFEHTEVIQ